MLRFVHKAGRVPGLARSPREKLYRYLNRESLSLSGSGYKDLNPAGLRRRRHPYPRST